MEFLNNQGLFCKAKSIVVSLAEIILWASGLASTMQTPNESQALENLKPGLKTLVHSQKEENPSGKTSHRPPLPPPEKIFHSYMASKSSVLWTTTSSSPPPPSSTCSSTMLDSLSSSSSSSSLTMGELIGSESGVYISSIDVEQILENQTSYSSRIHGKYRNRRNATKKQYPPPIPSLARTGNLPGRMPWVLTRDYTTDGRLVMKGVRVKRHEFFHAHRENGRLILKLIPLDDVIKDFFDTSGEKVEEEEDLELEDYIQSVVQEDMGKEKIVTEQEEESESDAKDENNVPESYSENIGSNKTMGKFPKCYTYANGMFMDSSKSFCNKGGKVHERPRHTFLDQSTSAPISPIASII
ncbi:hypothetical protein FNV43_RR10935 [Rhamnella rubrinervis]|uniref:FAF domain-containing protein n=1 Tax=Rhamnella rubrinervis TaxID=2594499 RepID=A0A8K0H513_9ROSA|nr:hypothetical protein FNV43_RR10935 [Rhamnella rubrinervis]